MGGFQTALVQPLHRCEVCLDTSHALVPGSIQAECWDVEQWDADQCGAGALYLSGESSMWMRS